MLTHCCLTAKSPASWTTFPPFYSKDEQTTHKAHDSPLEFTFDDPFEFESIDIKTEMAGASSPFIKAEPNDFQAFSPNHYQQHNGFHSHMQQQQDNFGSMHNGGSNNNNNNHNVDPNSIMNGGNFNQGFTTQNMSSSYLMGNSGIADDELMDTLSMPYDNTNNGNQSNFQQEQGYNSQYMAQTGSVPMSMAQQQHMNNNTNIYSSTPEGAPIQSPFINNHFNYGQFRPMETNNQQQQPAFNSYRNGSMAAVQQHMNAMERKISESRSPGTPNTPGIGGLHLGEPAHPVPSVGQQSRAVMGVHNRSSSLGNWDAMSNPHSWTEVSPLRFTCGWSVYASSTPTNH